jgi:hypothetical protein
MRAVNSVDKFLNIFLALFGFSSLSTGYQQFYFTSFSRFQ